MSYRRRIRVGFTAVLLAAAACGRPAPLSPEAAREKGDAMLREMSRTLAGSQAFSYRVEQAVEHVRATGERTTERFERATTVRRPNMLAFTDSGRDHDAVAWYDGSRLTIVSHREKIWVRGPMPGTLDEAMDFVSAEYAVQIPTADLLYGNPYEALMTADTTGGWVGVEAVGTRQCDRLSYRQAVVDWDVWLTPDERRLPCQLQIVYKTEPGQPVTRVVFHDWNPAPAITDATFTPAIPEGYRRITLMRHATVESPATATEEGGARD